MYQQGTDLLLAVSRARALILESLACDFLKRVYQIVPSAAETRKSEERRRNDGPESSIPCSHARS